MFDALALLRPFRPKRVPSSPYKLAQTFMPAIIALSEYDVKEVIACQFESTVVLLGMAYNRSIDPARPFEQYRRLENATNMVHP